MGSFASLANPVIHSRSTSGDHVNQQALQTATVVYTNFIIFLEPNVTGYASVMSNRKPLRQARSFLFRQ